MEKETEFLESREE